MRALVKAFTKESLVLFIFLGMDQLTKQWSQGLGRGLSWGFLRIEPRINRGLMLGAFSESPELLRMVTLSGIAAFLLCLYVFFRCFSSAESLRFREGFFLVLCEILGNCVDRFSAKGGVVDFIWLKLPVLELVVFNLADVFLASGIALSVVAQFRLLKNWHVDDKRVLRWPRGLQLRMALAFVGAGAASGMIYLAVGYSFLKLSLPQGSQFFTQFLLACLCVQLAQGLALFCLGTFLSEKVTGPLFAIRRRLEGISKGERSEFRLREGDLLRDFEEPLNEIQERLHSKEKNNEVA